MHIPISAFIVIVVIIGFLFGSTVYFYTQSRTVDKEVSQEKVFDGEIVTNSPADKVSRVDELTKPAEPRNRLSFPANTHTIAPLESLFGIAQQMEVPASVIRTANSIVDENILKAGSILLIPEISPNTDFYRLSFIVNDNRVSELNRQLIDQTNSEYFNVLTSAKTQAQNYFGVNEQDEFILLEHNKSNGTALVEAKKSETQSNLIGLVQPRTIGEKGIWVMIYVENRSK